MVEPLSDARTELRALSERGIDWGAPERMQSMSASARRAAVLVLFGSLDSIPSDATLRVARDLDVLLQRRAATMGHHPGQISFPGGGADPSDANLAQTALRESVEETGLDPRGVELLGELPSLGIPVSNNLVTPVLAWWTRASTVAAVDPAEAVDVFRMPVADLLAPANRATAVIHYRGRAYDTPAFLVGDALVWGFTGIVLDRLFAELGWTIDWDRAKTVDLD